MKKWYSDEELEIFYKYYEVKDLKECLVKHETYGEGKIIKIAKKDILIDFSELGIKEFSIRIFEHGKITNICLTKELRINFENSLERDKNLEKAMKLVKLIDVNNNNLILSDEQREILNIKKRVDKILHNVSYYSLPKEIKEFYKFSMGIDERNRIIIRARENTQKINKINNLISLISLKDYNLSFMKEKRNNILRTKHQVDKLLYGIPNNMISFEIRNFLRFSRENEKGIALKEELENLEKELSEIVNYKKTYIDKKLKNKFENNIKNIEEICAEKLMFPILKSKQLNKYINEVSNIEKNNDYILNERAEKFKLHIPNIDGKKLDKQQLKAVVTEEENLLVIAGAGTGKTLTIAGKVAYLVKYKNIDPSKILLITYTLKASEEMKERINEKLKIGVEVKTFHSLGTKLLRESSNEKRIIFKDKNQESVYNNFFKNLSGEAKERVINLLSIYKAPFVNKNLYIENIGEYYNEIKMNLQPLKSLLEKNQSLKGDRLKSLEEVIIADFLFLNGINYEYEKEYEFNTVSNQYKKQYEPDFYLTDYGIYLEHFGITEDNRVPWLNEEKEKRYLDGINWKRKEHIKNKTKLIETYSYYHTEGELVPKLKKLLLENNVVINPMSLEKLIELYEELVKRKKIGSVKNLFKSFLVLFKSNNHNINDIENIFKKEKHSYSNQRRELFKLLFEEFYKFYEREKGDRIDFTDMIVESTNNIREGKVILDYDYIIIDEYQDISRDRAELIKSIKNQCNAKIMAVGDDWQSIYRFAGSDVTLFTDFEKMFGLTKRLKIEKTYRNSQELIDVAGEFIQKNKNQIKKTLKSDKRLKNPIISIQYYDKDIKEQKIEKNKSKIEALEYALNKILIGREEVMFLVRSKKDIEFLRNNKNSNFKIVENNNKIEFIKYKNIKISLETVHVSKGLEADNIIILNCENSYIGFPNQISDDPILELLLSKKEEYPHAEERRLFYVALTRAKKKVIFLEPLFSPSVFLKELRYKKYSLSVEESVMTQKLCPECKTGHLVKKSSKFNDSSFYGCTNYPLCNLKINEREI